MEVDPYRFQYIRPEHLTASFKLLGPRIAVTRGHYELPSDISVNDLEWNLMDKNHRTPIHNNYKAVSRLVVGPSMAFSLTKMASLPFFVTVTDIRIKPGFHYQTYSFLGIWYVHSVIQIVRENGRSVQKVDYYVVSHRFFKFLHAFIIGRLNRNNDKVNREDASLRRQRVEARKKGYRFSTDNPDFLNSNSLTNNTRYPDIPDETRLPLGQIGDSEIHRMNAGPVDILAKKDRDGGFLIWPAVCPHEGGPLGQGEVCGDSIRCPWHHLNFPGTHVVPGKEPVVFHRMRLSLEKSDLVVQPSVLSGIL